MAWGEEEEKRKSKHQQGKQVSTFKIPAPNLVQAELGCRQPWPALHTADAEVESGRLHLQASDSWTREAKGWEWNRNLYRRLIKGKWSVSKPSGCH